jgi:hypothetical protein
MKNDAFRAPLGWAVGHFAQWRGKRCRRCLITSTPIQGTG